MEEQALKWWQVRWGLAGRGLSRFALISAKIIGLLCLLATIGYGVYFSISPWLASHRLGQSDSRLSFVPAPLATGSEAPLSASSITHYGVTFRLPNGEIDRTVYGAGTSFVLFRNGEMLELHDTTGGEPIDAMLTSFRSDKRARRLLGNEVLASRFNLMSAAISATPAQVKWWGFRSPENQRLELLLLTKALVLTEIPPARFSTLHVYSLASGEFRGFQIGNPDAAPYDAHLDLFSAADRHYELDITSSEIHGRVFTQEELNAMVASIRPAADY